MSHLPDSTIAVLTHLCSGIEEGLQEHGHKVGSAMLEHEAFEVSYVESPLIRSLIVWAAKQLSGEGLRMQELPMGGAFLFHVDDGTMRGFRMRRATRNSRGELVVVVSSDSSLPRKAPDPTLFDEDSEAISSNEDFEKWVLAYELHPGTRTFHKVTAAKIVGKARKRPPYVLKLADLVVIPHTAPFPPDFKPGKEDLNLPDEDEDRGEEAG